MRSADVFITLSDIEAFGITVIEALASDTPVIVNNAMSLSEFAKDFPEAVTAVDVHRTTNDELVKLIKVKIEQSQKNKKLNIDVRRYDWANITSSILKIYNEK